MAEESFEPLGDEEKDFVPAIVARTAEEAEYYRDLLSDHDIPAVVGDAAAADDDGEPDDRPGISRGVSVMVPEAFLDEASEIIADHDESDEFDLDEEVEDDEESEVVEGEELEGDEEDDEELEEEEESEEAEDEDEEDEFLDEEADEEEEEEEEGGDKEK